MYFGENIKIYGFDNESHFNTHLNYLFRSDNAQKWTNKYTARDECFTIGNPDDTGVFKFDLKMRKSVKDGFYNQWKYDMNHLYFTRVDCPRDDIFEWNKAMYKEMHTILHDTQKRHYYPILIIVHKDQPNEYCHFHMLLDYIDPNS